MSKLSKTWLGAYAQPNPYVIWPQEIHDLNHLWRTESHADRDLKERSFNLYSLARATAHLPGDTAECGVFQGAGSFMMCLALTQAGKTGFEHHAFDSFEGLSSPDEADRPDDARAQRWEQHHLAVSLAAVQHNLRRFDFIAYHPGWIPERFQAVADRSFALVHVDVDLYAPTYDSFAFFYERLVPGGMLICDDYGSVHCPGAFKAVNEFMASRPETVIHLTTGQALVIKQA